MNRRAITYIIFFSVFIISCQKYSKYNSISDFPKDLQAHLKEVVDGGILFYEYRDLDSMITDNELLRLTKSEHPLLRVYALSRIFERPSMEHFDLMMSHLDDTALVNVDRGEFGIRQVFVSDYMLEEGKWKSYESRNKTMEEVLKNHNYLLSAFDIPEKMELNETHLPYIRKIVNGFASHEGTIRFGRFGSFERILYTLASFQKEEDIQLVVQAMDYQLYRLGKTSFLLMRFFPDARYLQLLKKYALKYFNFNEESEIGDCINTIASYKNEESRKILEQLIEMDLKENKAIGYTLCAAILANECELYKKLRKEITPYMANKTFFIITPLPLKLSRYPIENAKDPEPIEWYN